MNGNITLGRGFGGVLRYVINKDGSIKLSTNMAGITASELAREFQEVRSQRDSVKRAVFHCSLSLPDGESVEPQIWDKVVRDFLEEMGFKDSQFYAQQHTDTDHDHVHIVANRVTYSGEVVSDKNDRRRANKACAKLEKKYGLQLSNHGELEHDNAKKISKTDRAMGFDSVKEELITGIDKALLQSLENDLDFSHDSFASECKKQGITVHFNKSKAGEIRGCSFSLSGSRKFSGSKLRRDLTLGNIKKRFADTSFKSFSHSTAKFTDSEKAIFIKAASKIGINAEQKSWGFKLNKGNWNAVAFDNQSSLKIKGFPKPELTAQIVVELAKSKGWQAIHIDHADSKTASMIRAEAEKSGIKIIEQEEKQKVEIKDVLRGRASESQLRDQQQQQNQRGVTKNKGDKSK